MASRPGAVALSLASILIAAPGSAQSTPILVAGGLVDGRSATAAPLLFLRWPLGETGAVGVHQSGWTSGIELTVTQTLEVAWHSAVELTPVRAQLSHDVYAADGVTPAPSFDHTAMRVRSGVVWRSAPLELRVHTVVAKHWISQAEWSGARVRLSLPASSRRSCCRMRGRSTRSSSGSRGCSSACADRA